MALYQGPVRPGDNEKVFRETGKTIPSYQGPVRPGDDEKTFRETGRTGPKSPSGGGSRTKGSYQGPVPAGADEQKFRETGVTDVKPETNTIQQAFNKGLSGNSNNKDLFTSSLTNKQEPTYKSTSLGILDTETGQYYDQNTGLPVREVRESNLYQSYTQGRNPITSNVDYAFEKIRQGIAKTEEVGDGQQLFSGETGQRVKSLARGGVYFVPVVGVGLALTEGTAQFTTSGGIKEIKNAKGWEKGLIVGQAGLNLAIGGASTIASASKLAKYPKYETLFFSKNVGKVGDEVTKVQTYANIRQKNLLSDSNFRSIAYTEVKRLPSDNSISPFIARTKGFSREVAIEIPTGKTKGVGKVIEYASVDAGTTSKQPVNFFYGEQNGLKLYRTIEGDVVKSAGQVQSSKINKVIQPTIYNQRYATIGEVVGNDKKGFGLFYSKPYSKVDGKFVSSKVGEVYSAGFFKNDIAPPVYEVYSSGTSQVTKSNSILNKAIAEQSVKNAMVTSLRNQEIAKQTAIITAGETFAKLKAISPILNQDKKPIYTAKADIISQNSVNVPTTITTPTNNLKLNDNIVGITKNFGGSGSASKSRTDQVLKPITDNAIKIDTTQKNAQGQGQSQRGKQIQRQQQLQKLMQIQINKPINRIKVPIVPFPKLSSGGSSKIKTGFEGFGNYSIFKKRYGKDILIGKKQSLSEATKTLKKSLKSDLGASGFIESGGSKVDLSSFSDYEFRPSKKSNYRLVQKANFRLGTGAEVGEIMSAKRKKGKRFSIWS